MMATPAQRLAAEALGTALLLATVVGSGIMAERLAGGNEALALLCNALPTGAMLVVLIEALAPVSGAHLNPAVTLVATLRGGLGARMAVAYATAQCAGAVAGVVGAHLMFGMPPLQPATAARSGANLVFAEAVATFGLVFAILAVSRARREALPGAVGLYVTAAYWFTASTSFANPAVTLGRTFSDSFTGIRPADAPAFVAAQFAGALVAWAVCRALLPGGSPGDGPRRSPAAARCR
jgi:glycerol uptake facilitator-like aquaporin